MLATSSHQLKMKYKGFKGQAKERQKTDLGSYGGPIEVELGVGELVAGVNGQSLGVEVVSFLPLAALEGRVAVLLLLTKQLGFLEKNEKRN